MTPADELTAAAHRLRSGALITRADLDPLLASLLEEHAAFAALFEQVHRAQRATGPAEREHTSEVRAALAVARAINGEQR